jgi:hypothetical protein
MWWHKSKSTDKTIEREKHKDKKTSDLNNPTEYDAVLGGQNMTLASAGVLGGIEEVKRRLLSQDVDYKIFALSEALKDEMPIEVVDMAHESFKYPKAPRR